MKIDYTKLYHIGDKVGTMEIIGVPFRKKTGNNGKAEWYVKCRCTCGRETVKPVSHLNRKIHLLCMTCSRKGKTKKSKHNMSHEKFYEVWHGVKRRVFSKSCKDYERYSKLGMYEPWKDFRNFRDDLIDGYYQHEKEHPNNTQLDRIDGSKGYYPGNVIWATCTENNRNKCTNRLIMCPDGIKRCVAAAAEKYKLPLKSRLQAGWDLNRAFNTPRRERKYNK